MSLKRIFNLDNFFVLSALLSLCSKIQIIDGLRLGDFLIFFCLVSYIVSFIVSKTIRLNRLSILIGILGICVVVSIFIGAPIPYILNFLNPENFMHDAISLLVAFLLLFLCSINRSKSDFMLFLSYLYSAIVLVSVYFILFGSIEQFFFEGGLRFSFLSENPNQFALLILPAPFVFLFQINCSYFYFNKVYNVFLFFLSIVIGYLIFSDALMVSWTISFFLIALVKIYEYLKSSPFKLLTACGIGIFVLLVAIYVNSKYLSEYSLKEYLDGISSSSDQGHDRIDRWLNALDAVKYSPIWGLGPGSYSGPLSAFSLGEAHNTFLDLLMCCGLIGLSIYFIFLMHIAKKIIKIGSVILIGLFVAINVFSLFHFLLRQPFFLLIMLVLVKNANYGKEDYYS